MTSDIEKFSKIAKESIPHGTLDVNAWIRAYNLKFTELIIQECIDNLELHSSCFDGDIGRGIKVAMRLTKEHFEVNNDLKAGLDLHEGGGYEVASLEEADQFAKKRNT
jgi:hypothetical protein